MSSRETPTATTVPISLSVPCIFPLSRGMLAQGVAGIAETHISVSNLDELFQFDAMDLSERINDLSH